MGCGQGNIVLRVVELDRAFEFRVEANPCWKNVSGCGA